MTELEKHLIAGFDKLAKQYSADMKQQQALNSQLQEQALQLQQQTHQLQNQVIELSQRVEQLTQLHTQNDLKLREDLKRTFSTLSAQLKELSES